MRFVIVSEAKKIRHEYLEMNCQILKWQVLCKIPISTNVWSVKYTLKLLYRYITKSCWIRSLFIWMSVWEIFPSVSNQSSVLFIFASDFIWRLRTHHYSFQTRRQQHQTPWLYCTFGRLSALGRAQNCSLKYVGSILRTTTSSSPSCLFINFSPFKLL